MNMYTEKIRDDLYCLDPKDKYKIIKSSKKYGIGMIVFFPFEKAGF